jgi:hypothetical protein
MTVGYRTRAQVYLTQIIPFFINQKRHKEKRRGKNATPEKMPQMSACLPYTRTLDFRVRPRRANRQQPGYLVLCLVVKEKVKKIVRSEQGSSLIRWYSCTEKVGMVCENKRKPIVSH